MKAVSFSVRLSKVPSSDPITFVAGYASGYGNGELPKSKKMRREIADAYIEGFELGRQVRNGEKVAPEWAKGA